MNGTGPDDNERLVSELAARVGSLGVELADVLLCRCGIGVRYFRANSTRTLSFSTAALGALPMTKTREGSISVPMSRTS
jgi:hypothetical protein